MRRKGRNTERFEGDCLWVEICFLRVFRCFHFSLMNRYWFSGASLGAGGKKNPPVNVGDMGLIPGLGRSPGEGIGNPLQYSCLESPMDRGLHLWVTVAKSWTWLNASNNKATDFVIRKKTNKPKMNKSRLTQALFAFFLIKHLKTSGCFREPVGVMHFPRVPCPPQSSCEAMPKALLPCP